ncbi:hypothetical protein [Polaribacter sp.]|uniref:hypothetical protein n=1 Tax=Polaribacter sp. TaxID=1920175 RepID=UPI0040472C38
MKIWHILSFLIFYSFPSEKKIESLLNNQNDINIESILKRIQSEKKDISTYILNNTKEEESIKLYSFTYKMRYDYNQTRQRSGRRIVVFKRQNIIKGEKSVKFKGIEPNSSNYTITVSFNELSKLSIYEYSYIFSFEKNINPDINFVDDDSNIIFGNGTYFDNPIQNEKRLKKRLTQYNFTKSNPKEYIIKFSKQEIEFLSKDNNLDKLKIALKELNLL